MSRLVYRQLRQTMGVLCFHIRTDQIEKRCTDPDEVVELDLTSDSSA